MRTTWTTFASFCALLLCCSVARAGAQVKMLPYVEPATGRTQTVPILESSGEDKRWQIHRPGARRLSEFVLRKAPTAPIADPVLMVLYAVAEQFSSPITFVPGHGHGASEEGVDFRIDGIGTNYVYDFCLRFSQLGVGLRTGSTITERFVHLETRRRAQCWLEPAGPSLARCMSENLVALRPPSQRVVNVLFVDAHDGDRPYWLALLHDAEGNGQYRVSPVARAQLQRLLRDRDTGAIRNIPDSLIFRLVQIYTSFGKRPIGILSGVRFTSSVAHSQHPKGTAIDFFLPGQDMMQLWRFCLMAFPDGGAGFYPKTAARMAFVHLDVRRDKACWVDPLISGQAHCPG